MVGVFLGPEVWGVRIGPLSVGYVGKESDDG
jgi:hypothetical protein